MHTNLTIIRSKLRGEGNVWRSILKHMAWHYSPHQHSIAILWWRGKWSVCPQPLCPSDLPNMPFPAPSCYGEGTLGTESSIHTQWQACAWKKITVLVSHFLFVQLTESFVLKRQLQETKEPSVKTCLPLNMTKWHVWFLGRLASKLVLVLALNKCPLRNNFIVHTHTHTQTQTL